MRRKDREITSLEDINSIISKVKVCHLAMVDNGFPYVVPLNYGYTLHDDVLTIYFHSAKAGRKIDALKENNAVCFEISYEGELGMHQNPCEYVFYYESVIGFGKVEFVENVQEKCEALTLLMKHQSNKEFIFTKEQADSVCVFKVESKDFVGKKKSNPNAVKNSID